MLKKNRGIAKVNLEVHEKNKIAISTYEKFGFTKLTIKIRLNVIQLLYL